MNEMSSIQVRPIELAIEAPFRLRTLAVTPAALEIHCGKDVTTIEPRVMQVLVALNRSQGHVVSREELLELCWEGRIVGDDSLNRSVSQLRKALSSDEGVFVDTIPRVGYRLRLEGEEPADPPQAAAHLPKLSVTMRTRLIGAAVLVGICGAAAAAYLSSGTPKSWSASGVRPLTQDPGVETFPALSPDGLVVAYAAGPGFGEPRDIYLRNVNLGDTVPVRITDTRADESSPAWSPDGGRIAFLRHGTDGECLIVMMTPPNGAERIVSECTNPYAGLAWLNPRELIVGDRPAGARARRLVAVDVTSGRTRALTHPPADTLGDASPAVSGNGAWVAFRRTAALGSDNVYLLDTKTETVRPLTNDGWKTAGFTWAADDRTLLFSSNRGGDFGLWAIDAVRGGKPSRITLGMLPLGRISTDRQSRHIAIETGRTQANLVRYSPDGSTQSPITSGEGSDWDPDTRADGSTLFGSDRDGTNQIWTRQPDGRTTRLTDMTASFIYAPRWSQDGSRILFLAVVDGLTDVYSIRPDGSGLIRVTKDGAPKGRAVWSSDRDAVFYTVIAGSGWQLMKQDLQSGRNSVVGNSTGITIVERAGTRLFARRVDGGPIMEIDPQSGAVQPLSAQIEVEGLEAWAPRADGIVHVRGTAPAAELWLTNWGGESRRLASVRQASRAPIAIAADGSIIASQLMSDNRDIIMIDLD